MVFILCISSRSGFFLSGEISTVILCLSDSPVLHPEVHKSDTPFFKKSCCLLFYFKIIHGSTVYQHKLISLTAHFISIKCLTGFTRTGSTHVAQWNQCSNMNFWAAYSLTYSCVHLGLLRLAYFTHKWRENGNVKPCHDVNLQVVLMKSAYCVWSKWQQASSLTRTQEQDGNDKSLKLSEDTCMYPGLRPQQQTKSMLTS